MNRLDRVRLAFSQFLLHAALTLALSYWFIPQEKLTIQLIAVTASLAAAVALRAKEAVGFGQEIWTAISQSGESTNDHKQFWLKRLFVGLRHSVFGLVASGVLLAVIILFVASRLREETFIGGARTEESSLASTATPPVPEPTATPSTAEPPATPTLPEPSAAPNVIEATATPAQDRYPYEFVTRLMAESSPGTCRVPPKETFQILDPDVSTSINQTVTEAHRIVVAFESDLSDRCVVMATVRWTALVDGREQTIWGFQGPLQRLDGRQFSGVIVLTGVASRGGDSRPVFDVSIGVAPREIQESINELITRFPEIGGQINMLQPPRAFEVFGIYRAIVESA